MTPRRVFALPRQQSLFLPAVLNPFVQEVKLAKADIIKVSIKCKINRLTHSFIGHRTEVGIQT